MSSISELPYCRKLKTLSGLLVGLLVSSEESTEVSGACMFLLVEKDLADEFGRLIARLANPVQEFDWHKIDGDVVVVGETKSEIFRITPANVIYSPDKRAIGKVELF